MNKLIMTGSYPSIDAPAVQLMDVHSRGVDSIWMQKRAAVLTKEIASVRPEPGKSFFHLIAMGDSETYGPNRNADGFSKQANQTKHHTFVTNGHVFKNHVNHDPKNASGQVRASAYNPAMSRTELLISVDNDKWDRELEKVARGDDLAFSMACKVAYDTCTICGNNARTQAAYCDCMKKHAGQILEDGRQVYVDNPDPEFFDISGVVRPADRIAYQLQKVASAVAETGADLYDQLMGDGIPTPRPPLTKRSNCTWEKIRTLRKLAEIEKEIELSSPGEAASLIPALGQGSLCCSDAETLTRSCDKNPEATMTAMADEKVMLSLEDFMKLFSDVGEGADLGAIEDKLPGIFNRMLETDDADIIQDGSYDTGRMGASILPNEVKNVIESMVPDMSLDEGPAGQRAQITIIRKSASGVLKSPNGIHSLVTDKADFNADLWSREYAKYKLAFMTKLSSTGDLLAMKLGVLQNYVS